MRNLVRWTRRSFVLPFAATVLAVFVASACSDTSEVAAPDAIEPGPVAFSNGGEIGALALDHRKDLAALRRLLAPFHDIDRARAAGWDTPITPCLELPGTGAMGVHWANPGLMGDGGEVAVDEPETLIYEPRGNQKPRLVGVEYIVPLGDSEDAPMLFGQHFHRNEAVGIWALHVWIPRHNPLGTFADWNPKVSCAAVH